MTQLYEVFPIREFRAADVPELPPHRFEPGASIFFRHMPPIAICIQGEVIVSADWALLSVCRKLGNQMDKKGCVALLLWNDEGEVWQHYPQSGFDHLPIRGRLAGAVRLSDGD